MAGDGFGEYLAAVNKAYGRGNATEHTYRPALQAMIEGLKKGVVATNEPKREKCGAPDYVISRRVRRREDTIGHIEAKDVGSNLTQIARSEQIKKRYLPALGNFILTDYIEFRWYVGGEHRLTAKLAEEGAGGLYAASEDGVKGVGELLAGFLGQGPEEISTPRIMAERMAGIARLLREMIEKTFEGEGERGALHEQLEAFRTVLIHDLDERQFADMYAQTICYGLFAARCHIEDSKLLGNDKHAVFHGADKRRGEFTREHAAYLLPKTNPFLQKLFHHIAGPDLPEEIAWLVDDLVGVLKKSQMDKVLAGFAKESKRKDPVIHFYETFLAEYDRKLRKTRGVYYTPEPVVGYIVRSVDHILKTRFGLRSGLADKSKIRVPVKREAKRGKGEVTEWQECHKVLVLDPAAGTGTFLHEVVAEIYKKFARNKGAWAGYVKEHLLPRLYGFELMMAPYAMAHMKLGLQLAESGYDFESDERLRIFLTNTLEEAEEMGNLPLFTQWLTEEARQANSVKQELPIMVVLGNPPYSYVSANTGEWISKLVRDYYECDGKPLGERNPKGLQDDYVKFIRFAQWRIQETGSGVLAFITNHGYLDNPTFRGMRQQLMKTFTDIYVLDLHGNSKKKERCPDCSEDKNVFDIQQGVCIGMFVKEAGRRAPAKVYHADAYGGRRGKYEWLGCNDIITTQWGPAKAQKPFYTFKSQNIEGSDSYWSQRGVPDVFGVTTTGVKTHRDSFVVDSERNALLARIEEFANLGVDEVHIRNKYGLRDTRDWNLKHNRAVLSEEKSLEKSLLRYNYRPFDVQHVFFSGNVIELPRMEVNMHMVDACVKSIYSQKTS